MSWKLDYWRLDKGRIREEGDMNFEEEVNKQVERKRKEAV